MTTVIFTSVYRDRLNAYVDLRRSLGFHLGSQVYILGKFDRVIQREMSAAGPITRAVVEAFLGSLGGLLPITRHRQLSIVRQFLLHLSQFEPETFIPDHGMEPARGFPRAPHIYSEREIQALLTAALAYSVRPRGALRPLTYHTLIAFLYATGMRISETLDLRLGDVDFRQGVIKIRKAKFDKSRLVPVLPSTCEGLKRYLVARAERGHPTTADAALFVNESMRPVCYPTASATFNKIARRAGLRGSQGTRGPRIHDLRHSFAVRRLLLWYRQGKKVQALLHVLATYMGHSHVSALDVYLTATSELLAEAGARFERHFPLDVEAHGGITS